MPPIHNDTIAPIGFATCKGNIVSGTMSLDEFRWRWAAPDLQRPDEYDTPKVVAMKARRDDDGNLQSKSSRSVRLTLGSHPRTGSDMRDL